MHMAIDSELRLPVHQTLLAEDPLRIRLLNRALHHLRLMVILTANEEVRSVELTRAACDCDAFKHLMRIEVHEQSILECSRLRFIAVDAEIASTTIDWWKECPL